MVQLLGRGRLEGVHLAALRVDAAHDVLDGAVLAGGIHGLEHQQQRVLVLGVEPLLHLGEVDHALAQCGLRALLVAGAFAVVASEDADIARVVVAQAEALAAVDAVGLGESFCTLGDPGHRVVLHGSRG